MPEVNKYESEEGDWEGDWLHHTVLVKDGKYAEFSLTIKAVHAPGTITFKNKKTCEHAVLEFAETKKRFPIKATNQKLICGNFGSDVKDWVGKKITVYPVLLDNVMGQRNVGGIRFRPTGKAAIYIADAKKHLGKDLTGESVS